MEKPPEKNTKVAGNSTKHKALMNVYGITTLDETILSQIFLATNHYNYRITSAKHLMRSITGMTKCEWE